MAHLNEDENEGQNEAAIVLIELTTDHDNDPIVAIAGELDLSTIESIRPTIDAIVATQPKRLTFELSGLRFLDSSGIAILAEAAYRVETVVLSNASGLIRRVLESTGLKDIFRFEP